MKTWSTPTKLLAVCLLASGFSTFMFEPILGGMMGMVLGGSIEHMGATFMLMVIGMGVATLVQMLMNEEHLIEKFIIIESALSILGAFAPILMYLAFAHFTYHSVLFFYVIAFAIGFLMGFEIPLAMRINNNYTPDLKVNLVQTYMVDLFGGGLALVVWKLVVGVIPFTLLSFYVAAMNLIIALATYVYFIGQSMVKRVWLPRLSMAIALVGLATGYIMTPKWEIHAQQQFYDDPIIYHTQTSYQTITLTKWVGPTGEDFRLYLNTHLQMSSQDEAIYHEELVHPAMHLAAQPDRVLILGGGDGGTLREVLKYDVQSVTLVELDPAMIEFARTHPAMRRINDNSFAGAHVDTITSHTPIAVSDKSVQVYIQDADLFLTHTQGDYDVIICDFPDPRTPELAKLYSKEFYLKARSVLAADGVIIVQSTSAQHCPKPFWSIHYTLESAGFSVVPMHVYVPSFRDWGFNLGMDHVTPEQILVRLEAIQEWKVSTTEVTPAVAKASLAFIKSMKDDSVPVNTMTFPVLVRLYRDSWVL